ncbi:Glu-tRNA(Gln) amidotransferase subunit GatE [Candidatus Micrarchaeota archaeon]|nr:Glu-tRNA(Gln) amidotransferase subunit GatE [Candidatus Micrarchaeota archaeon]
MKLGLEIHQRLQSKKLFCEDGCDFAEGEPDIIIQRRLHPVLSELGETDDASKAEFSKNKIFEYQAFKKHNCLVELDEEPPRKMNEEALKIALEIALQLNAIPVDEVQIMRKIVIDGSNTSGFQRTAIIALNGHLETSKGPVKIPTIAIEEESAGIVSSSEDKVVYRLDRLGIPLIEITTDPDIRDPEHLLETAEKIGMVLRATGKVARGLGTIRQDVNISTEGGARVELKGAQNLKILPKYAETEAKRQTELVKIIHELRTINAFPLKSAAVDVTSIFKKTQAAVIEKGISSGAVVLAAKLPKFRGIPGRQIQPGKRFGTELSQYARMAGVKGIIHGDEDLGKYKISEDEQKQLRKKLELGDQDSFIIVVAPERQALNAINNAITRAGLDFVPKETRKANPDGTSSFLRPLPGKARLYPETDVPVIPITKEFLSSIEQSESLEDKKKNLEKILNKELASKMLKSRHLRLFEKLVEKGADPKLTATTLEETIVSLRREGVEFSSLEMTVENLFDEYSRGTFVKAAIPDILKAMAKGASAESVIKVYRFQKITGEALEKLIEEEGRDLKKIMAKYRLQVDPQELSQLMKR